MKFFVEKYVLVLHAVRCRLSEKNKNSQVNIRPIENKFLNVENVGHT